jgi:uncharacterized protein YndB with AHSA1/START domain
MAAEPEVTQYHLTTRWAFDAPVGSVWAELVRPEAWPQWWKGMSDVRLLEQGDSSGMGAYRRITWKGVLPARFIFNMRTVKVQPRALIESIADGQLTGVGRWQLTRAGAGTQVQHDWIVNVPLPRIALLGPIAGLLFKWNHRALMAAGRKGLQSRVGVHSATPPGN